MLHHPFTAITDLLTASGVEYPTFSKAFDACRYSHNHEDDFYTDPTELTEEDIDSDSDTEDEAPEEEEPLGSFEAFARRRPQDKRIVESRLSELGLRGIDRAYDWSSHVGKYYPFSSTIWQELKGDNPVNLDTTVNSAPGSLNP